MDLSTPISNLGIVGKTAAKRLKNLDLESVKDLLLYFPFRYDDYSKILAIKDLQAGEPASIIGTIEIIQNKRSHKRRMFLTEALINDGTGYAKAIWFNQPYLSKTLKAGDEISLAGRPEQEYDAWTFVSPVYEKTKKGEAIHTQGLVPIYHLTGNLTNKQVRYLISQAMKAIDELDDWVPAAILKQLNFISYPEAIKKIHFPKTLTDIEAAQKRLAFDELFLLQLQSQIVRQELKSKRSPEIKFLEAETKNFVKQLPFKLTDAQRQAAWEILNDIAKDRPMSRLVEGDVGSGKTVVAGLGLLNVALNKKLGVMLAPTEILAQQHYTTLVKLFSNFEIKICLYTRSYHVSNFEFRISNFESMSKSQRLKETISQAEIIIGTHALLQDSVELANLGLVIIDEQHRFGVDQRARLLDADAQGLTPHLLSMTATPIPRTLALSIYGDLDISIINQMPSGRKPIITKVVDEFNRVKAYEFLRDKIIEGRQAFVICPLIDMSDKLGVKSVKEEFEKLQTTIFPEFKVAMLHGKLKSKEKEEIMNDFKDNKTQILVSTSVVEVGVDVPNASVMLIEGAERFGLSQLHQFRGRIGRGEHQSYCMLFTESRSPKTIERLQAMEKYRDGFSLSKIDLKFRGPGEVYGTSQSGFPELKVASLFDYELMKQARDFAQKIIEEDPELKKHTQIKNQLTIADMNVHLE